jgi:hypothetical protein
MIQMHIRIHRTSPITGFIRRRLLVIPKDKSRNKCQQRKTFAASGVEWLAGAQEINSSSVRCLPRYRDARDGYFLNAFLAKQY